MTKKKNLAEKNIVALFLEYYREYHGEEYHVNWPIIKAAEKVAAFYKVDEVVKAMSYYFKTFDKHDFWQFIENIDKYLKRAIIEDEAASRLERLIKITKERMNQIEHRDSTDNEDPRD